MVLARGAHIETLYYLEAGTLNECNSSIVFEVRNETRRIPFFPEKMTMVWHQSLGCIGEKWL